VVDKEQRFIFLNESYIKEFDLELEDIINRRIEETSCGIPDSLRDIIGRCLKGDTLSSSEEFKLKDDGKQEKCKRMTRKSSGLASRS
jgi:hypothetical protein